MKRMVICFMLFILFSSFVEEKNNGYGSFKESIREKKVKDLDTINNCQYTTYSPFDADYIANNMHELRVLIDSKKVADNSIIYLKDDGVFQLNISNDIAIEIKRPLKIVSGRKENNSNGAMIFTNLPDKKLFVIKSNNVTLSGFKIIGYDTEVGDFPYSPGITWGVYIEGYDSLRVENCEISGWSEAGIELINSKNNRIISNYIHHNRRTGLGYGISLHNQSDIQTNALISCNFFEFNRHDIAASGGKNQSYEASYNIIGEPGVKTHRFDMHGANGDSQETAGTNVKIHHNNFLFDTDLAIMIRGVAEQGVEIYDNKFKHKCEVQAIEQRKFNIPLNRENWISINAYNNNYSNIGINNIVFNKLFLFKNDNDEIIKYSFGNECNCNNESGIFGKGFQNLKKFLVGNWTGGKKDDIVALNTNGNLVLFPYKDDSFYEQDDGLVLGTGFNVYKDFFVGNWIGNGNDDIIALTKDGKMVLFPFDNHTFNGKGSNVIVGQGFQDFKIFLVGDWTGDGTDDLIVMSNSGDLIIYPFRNGTFFGQGGGVIVGNGFSSYKKFFVGNWTGDGTDDLIALSNDDNLILFPFRKNTFYGQGGPITVGTGFANFKDFIVCSLPNKPTHDLIAINASNQLYIYHLQGNYLTDVKQIGCIKDYNLILNSKWLSNH